MLKLNNHDNHFVGQKIIDVRVEACNYIVFELKDDSGCRNKVAVTVEVEGQLPVIYKEELGE